MIRVLHTESGARYEINEVAGVIRRDREEFTPEKRGDREWLRLLTPLPGSSTVGFRLALQIEPLAKYGPDDEGNLDPATEVTTRYTTTVIYDSIDDNKEAA